VRAALSWALLLALLLNTTAHAQLRLILEPGELDGNAQRASQALLEEALNALPMRLREALNSPVKVVWETLPAQVYGRASRSGIALNARLLPSLVDGSAADKSTGRNHATLRRELLATVLHELVHLYDRGAYWNSTLRKRLRHCQQQNIRLGAIGLPPECRGQTERRFTLSDDPELLDLAGWPQRIGTRGLRETHNAQRARSPDPYELSNPREFVAVNLEYFLLDPEYSCRRPSLAHYFSNHFAWTPPRATCNTGYAYLNAGRDFTKRALASLDPKRVYQVDYLLAEANQNLVSRWGHSMLRLVVCAPNRTPGPACRLDIEQHLVLSFRAFVGDVQLSSWGGLSGTYPSRLFILPLTQVIDEYTKLELRSLASVPLKLSQESIEKLLAHALEQHWSYDGHYFFISNNCAVETLKLLRSGTADPRLQDLDSITPNGLLHVLDARDLADTGVLKDAAQARRLGYRFDSFRDRYQAMFSILQQQLPIPQARVEDWLQLPASARSKWFDHADMRSSAALLLLEQAAQLHQLLLSQEELKKRYLSGRGGKDKELDQADEVLHRLLASSGFLSRPAELLKNGYGLPQPREWQQLQNTAHNRQKQLGLINAELDQQVRRLLSPERIAEMQASEQNLRWLGAHLQKLHKDSGGLQLR
jgi:hypothetical protein